MISRSSAGHRVLRGGRVSTDCFKMKDGPSADRPLKRPHNLTGSLRILPSSFPPEGSSALHLMGTRCERTGWGAAGPFGCSGNTVPHSSATVPLQEAGNLCGRCLNGLTARLNSSDAQRQSVDTAECASFPGARPVFFFL